MTLRGAPSCRSRPGMPDRPGRRTRRGRRSVSVACSRVATAVPHGSRTRNCGLPGRDRRRRRGGRPPPDADRWTDYGSTAPRVPSHALAVPGCHDGGLCALARDCSVSSVAPACAYASADRAYASLTFVGSEPAAESESASSPYASPARRRSFVWVRSSVARMPARTAWP